MAIGQHRVDLSCIRISQMIANVKCREISAKAARRAGKLDHYFQMTAVITCCPRASLMAGSFLILSCSIFSAVAFPNSDPRLDSLDAVSGSVLFVSSAYEGLPEPALCAVRVQTSEVEFVLFRHPRAIPLPVGPTPVWGVDTREVYFLGEIYQSLHGVLYLNRDTGQILPVLPSGTFALVQNLPELGPVQNRSDSLKVSIGIQGFGFNRMSNSLYALVNYRAHSRQSGRSEKLDSSVVAIWMLERIKSKLAIGDRQWTDLVSVRNNRDVSLVVELQRAQNRKLAVSPDERYFAFADDKSVTVFDRVADTFLVIAPPESLLVDDVTFSKKSGLLTIVTLLPHKSCSIFTSSPPRFEDAQPVLTDEPPGIWAVRWSNDDRIMMIRRSSSHLPWFWQEELNLLDVDSGKRKDIRYPYTLDGKNDSRIFINTGIDWVE